LLSGPLDSWVPFFWATRFLGPFFLGHSILGSLFNGKPYHQYSVSSHTHIFLHNHSSISNSPIILKCVCVSRILFSTRMCMFFVVILFPCSNSGFLQHMIMLFLNRIPINANSSWHLLSVWLLGSCYVYIHLLPWNYSH